MFESLRAGPHFHAPSTTGDVGFGDVFEGSFFLDLFARDDTRLVGGGSLQESLVPKLGAWMNTTLDPGAISLYSPSFTAKEADRFALAHASFLPGETRHRAILISDSCLTATALAQGREKRSVAGRLLFAPLNQVDRAIWSRLVEEPDFSRFPLPDNDLLKDTVAELGNCFMVDARSIEKHAASRIARPSSEVADELEAHWCAFASRRGPRAYERNLLKLASLLSGGDGQLTEYAQTRTDAVADFLDGVWVLEGKWLEEASDAEENVRVEKGDAGVLTPPLVATLSSELRDLAQRAIAAADALDQA